MDLPIWDPATAASAGAGFAGILGAILIAVTFQIVLSRRRGLHHRRGYDHLHSQAAGPFAIVLTLTAAYLYVVLSGTTGTTRQVLADCLSASPSPQCQGNMSLVAATAAMFAIGGSYLGLGAIALAFTLVAAVDEHYLGKFGPVRDAALLIFSGGSAISIIALVWGYRDATWLFAGERLTVWEFLWYERAGLGLLIGLAAGFMMGLLYRRVGLHRASADSPLWQRIFRTVWHLILLAYVVTPVCWYMLVQETTPGSNPTGQDVVTQAMLSWVAAGTGFFIYWLPQLRRRRVRPASAKRERATNPSMTPLSQVSEEQATPARAPATFDVKRSGLEPMLFLAAAAVATAAWQLVRSRRRQRRVHSTADR